MVVMVFFMEAAADSGICGAELPGDTVLPDTIWNRILTIANPADSSHSQPDSAL